MGLHSTSQSLRIRAQIPNKSIRQDVAIQNPVEGKKNSENPKDPKNTKIA